MTLTDEELNSQAEGLEWDDDTRFLEHISQATAADTDLLEFMSQIDEDPMAPWTPSSEGPTHDKL